MENPKVRLYVNSSKIAVGTENITIDKPTVQIIASQPRGIVIPPRIYPTRETKTVTKYDYVLPEHQRRIVETVREVATKYGFRLEVIDVAQIDLFDEDMPKKVKALGNFPVLATESQAQLALGLSGEEIEKFFSQEFKMRESKPES